MSVFKKIKDFNGNSSRKEFLIYFVALYCVVRFTIESAISIYSRPIEGVLSILALIFFIAPMPALIVRRLNDCGRSVKWLLSLISLLFISISILICMKLCTYGTSIYNILFYFYNTAFFLFIINCFFTITITVSLVFDFAV